MLMFFYFYAFFILCSLFIIVLFSVMFCTQLNHLKWTNIYEKETQWSHYVALKFFLNKSCVDIVLLKCVFTGVKHMRGFLIECQWTWRGFWVQFEEIDWKVQFESFWLKKLKLATKPDINFQKFGLTYLPLRLIWRELSI